ncbi:E3 ubiquitin-protein ligase At1g63170-like [Zingiber officinale]|uniref:E3 ubiquitin-protein ligase At1g63170-like n=1 Tax=Zingiber officinale TaxID=94328 RepID=UPI001C4D2993|nr:E3 ubiquitin-protein ligase At1g63170-like [Zingiber officinale]XP_042442008.1 E3 ubiquitin-protein ligase At1g63170-like [Zingiber officinale]XP_042442009.1 E3 ubiquitin-protein ligase At1g63170-like [Zingiber officinale]
MERAANLNGHEYIIGISESNDVSTSLSSQTDDSNSHGTFGQDNPSINTGTPVSQLALFSQNVSNSTNSSLTRTDNHHRRNRGPLNSGLWITVELVANVSQIIAAIIVLSLSRHEHPRTPLFVWIIGYTAGCVSTLPYLCWRYLYVSSQTPDQDPAHSNQGATGNNHPESSVYADRVITRNPPEENGHNPSFELGQTVITSPRINAIVGNFKTALDCFFAVWFVVGNIWVFGGHSSSHDAPNLYRLCIVFLAFSCIGYALPFLLCTMICCCLPCFISIMGMRDDTPHGRGATSESINELPSYKFKSRRQKSRGNSDFDSHSSGGILAAGTDKERTISAEDAVCCICLSKYVDNDELRELPCTHFFHKECVDKWLKLNALCPLCKAVVGATSSQPSVTDTGIHHYAGLTEV